MIPGIISFSSGGFMSQFFLGIDISKGYADFVMIDAVKSNVGTSFQLDDTFQGHVCLFNYLSEFKEQHAGCTIFAGLESTGGYENNWYQMLLNCQELLPVRVARLNPAGVFAYKKANLNRINTDPISARAVAEYLITHSDKVSYHEAVNSNNPSCSMRSLRKHWGFIQMLTKQKTQLLNQLEMLLYEANPDLLHFCKNHTPQWVLTLLLHYPTAKRLARAHADSLAKIPYISKKRAASLIEQAKNSVASSSDAYTEQLIISTVKEIMHLKTQIRNETNVLARHCSFADVELITTFPGISVLSAVGLFIHIQSVARFATTKQIASFFGLNPVFSASGDSLKGSRMSKKGNKQVRQILFMIALSAIQSNPVIRNTYARQKSKGMSNMAAIGACMHKILRIVYGMLKNRQAFDPNIDRYNRLNQRKTVATENADNRRLQEYDETAPVSQRQIKKRWERKQTQNGFAIESGFRSPSPPHIV